MFMMDTFIELSLSGFKASPSFPAPYTIEIAGTESTSFQGMSILKKFHYKMVFIGVCKNFWCAIAQ
jgi:hypothetical protein